LFIKKGLYGPFFSAVEKIEPQRREDAEFFIVTPTANKILIFLCASAVQVFYSAKKRAIQPFSYKQFYQY